MSILDVSGLQGDVAHFGEAFAGAKRSTTRRRGRGGDVYFSFDPTWFTNHEIEVMREMRGITYEFSSGKSTIEMVPLRSNRYAFT
jgi:hypothetical protein